MSDFHLPLKPDNAPRGGADADKIKEALSRAVEHASPGAVPGAVKLDPFQQIREQQDVDYNDFAKAQQARVNHSLAENVQADTNKKTLVAGAVGMLAALGLGALFMSQGESRQRTTRRRR